MSPRFPPNTKIKDFGYPESHPLHYAASIKQSRKLQLPDEDGVAFDEDDESDTTSTTSSLDESYHRSRDHESLRYEDRDVYGHNPGLDYGYDDDEFEKDEINCEARAIFDFQPENDNEIGLLEGQVIWISYRHGQGWLVAEDPETGENGLVPEEYVELIGLLERVEEREEEEEEEDVAKPFLPEILRNQEPVEVGRKSDDEWVDTDDESSMSNLDMAGKIEGEQEDEFVDALDKSVDEMKI